MSAPVLTFPRRIYTTPAQDAATIRAELKRRGWTSRDVSVRAESFSMGSAVRLTVKRPGIPVAVVEQIARDIAEKIDRCEITGEILSGGNRYVSASLDGEAVAPLRSVLRRRLEEWPADGFWHPLVAGIEVCRQPASGPSCYGLSKPGESRIFPMWDAAAAVDFTACYLFQHYAAAAFIAETVSR